MPSKTCNTYVVRRCKTPPRLEGCARRLAAGWADADVLAIDSFHPKSCDHRPQTSVRLLYDAHAIYARFDVVDRYVFSVHTQPQSNVCRDSCVEFFVQPNEKRGYFNFETNAGGCLLLYYIEDSRRKAEGGFRSYREVDAAWLEKIAIAHSMPSRVEPEIAPLVKWSLSYRIPLALMTAYTGEGGVTSGDVWRANFYKCGSNHPHWASWNPIGARCDFHQPGRFGELHFA